MTEGNWLFLKKMGRPTAAVIASTIIASYFAGDIFLYIAILLILFVLSPGAH